MDKLYYINKFTLYDIDLKLSLLTSKRLSDDLLAVRRQLPIILFQFENASIVLGQSNGNSVLCKLILDVMLLQMPTAETTHVTL